MGVNAGTFIFEFLNLKLIGTDEAAIRQSGDQTKVEISNCFVTGGSIKQRLIYKDDEGNLTIADLTISGQTIEQQSFISALFGINIFNDFTITETGFIHIVSGNSSVTNMNIYDDSTVVGSALIDPGPVQPNYYLFAATGNNQFSNIVVYQASMEQYLIYVYQAKSVTIDDLYVHDLTKLSAQVINFQSGSLTLTNSVFERLESTVYFIGGVIYINIQNEADKVQITNCNFTECTRVDETPGGAIGFNLYNKGQLEIDGACNFNECEAIGGCAIYGIVQSGASLIIEDECLFYKCSYEIPHSSGALELHIQGGEVIIQGACKFVECISQRGGAIYSIIQNNGLLNIGGECIFDQCVSSYGGAGAVYVNIQNQGQLILDNACYFDKCISEGPYYGGGALDLMLFEGGGSVIIREACVFNSCECIQSEGGALNIYIQDEATMLIEGACIFDRCTS
ncbi:MAG: hypothetical protein EZS28_004524, partial [Streblomastix strix]